MTARDAYPVAETDPGSVRSSTGTPLDAITLEAIASGRLAIGDLGIAPEGLRAQARIARDAGRPTLAANLERAAELVDIPEALLLRVYELLRPGRAQSAQELREVAAELRTDHRAVLNAAMVEEAALHYERRQLFRRRY